MIIRARAPLRLGLAGGGTDVAPYCDIHGGYVLNVTIDRYAYAVVKILDETIIRFVATDQQLEQVVGVEEEIVLDGRLDLHKAVYSYMIDHYNNGRRIPLELSTFCDAPIGSGLGSSSTLVVAMIKTFVDLLNLAFDDYTIASLAYKIERIQCALQGGRQDHYSATFGGFNFMEFYSNEKTIVNPLKLQQSVICELEASLVLFFTGVSRESAKIIADQSANVKDGDMDSINAMHGIKDEALKMKDSLLRSDFAGFVESLRAGWENKKMSAKTVTNSHIENIYNKAIESGASAGKVSGAGGGGFMLFFVPTEKRMNLIRTLSKFNRQVSNCHFTKTGVQSWRVS